MTEHEATATFWMLFLTGGLVLIVGIQLYVEHNERAGRFADRLLTRLLGEPWGDL